MSGRKTFVAGEILTASDVNSFLMDQSVQVYDDATARDTALSSPSEGQVTYTKDLKRVEVFDGSVFTPVGRVLQVVRATDTTERTTTSASFVDANISVTITPTATSSNIIVLWSFDLSPLNVTTNSRMEAQITDSGNSPISGAEETRIGSGEGGAFYHKTNIVGFDNPATTNATTYKGRFRRTDAGTTARIFNDKNTGQMFAIEVAG